MTRSYALCLSLAFAAAGNAFATDITIDPNPFVSTLSRAQVKDELRQHRMAGANPWADDYDQLAHFKSTTTRAQVMAEFHDARNQVAALNGEDSGSAYLAQMNAPATRRATILAHK